MEVIRFDSKCCAVAITSSDSNHRFNRADKNLAVSDFAGTCSIGDGFDNIVHAFVIDDDVDFEFLQELNGEF